MANRKGKLTPIKNVKAILRAATLGSTGAIAVIATDTPVRRWDEVSKQTVLEVMLMEGCVFRGGRDQIPIVDSHDDTTVRNVVGSIQRMHADLATGELSGLPVWSTTSVASDIQTLVSEGHVTDFSITAMPLETIEIKRGETYTTSRGETIAGPAWIHTKWEPHNASICATGADVNSVIRRSYTEYERVERMDEALLGQLSSVGLPEGMTDPNQIIAWMVGKLSTQKASEPEPIESMAEETAPVAPEEKKEETMAVENQPDAAAIARAALAQDKIRRKEIHAACKLARLDATFADSLCDAEVSIDEARKRIIERGATQEIGTSVGGDIRITESEDDKFYAAARDGLIMRTHQAGGFRSQAFATERRPSQGAEDFSRTKLSRLAETIAERLGAPVKRMAPKDIALVALGDRGAWGRFRIQRDVYHTTGSFPNLLLDASTKSLIAGYEEAPYTWAMWARQGTSVDDMKNINRIRFSAMGTPELVPEAHEYQDVKTGDEREVYRVEKYGSMFSVSWETVVNDDLDALSRIPAMQGAACRRKQNQVVYSVLTTNAAMRDTGLLFNTTAQTTAGGHANLAGSTGAPSVTTLNAGYLSMMTKTGITVNGVAGPILNLQPSYIIVPAALGATALQLMGSIADPAAGGSAAGNSNTLNIYGPNGARPIKVIIEPVLDASSATSWYLAASNNQCDTVELTFLSGEESPVLESDWVMVNDTYQFKVRQTFAAAAIDFRGLYKNAG